MDVHVSKDKKVFEVEYGSSDSWKAKKMVVLALDYSTACAVADNYLVEKRKYDLANMKKGDIVDADGGIKKDYDSEDGYKIRGVKELANEFIW